MKTDTAYKNKTWGHIITKEYCGNPYREGDVYTNFGIVKVYAQKNQIKVSIFTMVVCGCFVSRSVDKFYTEIGLSRIANKFAKEMYQKYSSNIKL